MSPPVLTSCRMNLKGFNHLEVRFIISRPLHSNRRNLRLIWFRLSSRRTCTCRFRRNRICRNICRRTCRRRFRSNRICKCKPLFPRTCTCRFRRSRICKYIYRRICRRRFRSNRICRCKPLFPRTCICRSRRSRICRGICRRICRRRSPHNRTYTDISSAPEPFYAFSPEPPHRQSPQRGTPQ